MPLIDMSAEVVQNPPARQIRPGVYEDEGEDKLPYPEIGISGGILGFVWLTIIAVVLRYCFADGKDPFKCGALLSEGVWLDPPSLTSRGLTNWQPPGCMLHHYQSKDVSHCLSSRKLVFIGDSNMRNVFWATARILDPKSQELGKGEKHSDVQFQAMGVDLEFIWDPYLNGSRVGTEVAGWKYEDGKLVEGGGHAAVLVLGTGLWYARYESQNPIKAWRDTIDGVVQHMHSGRPRSLDIGGTDRILLAPIPVPAYSMLNQVRKESISPDVISAMNSYLKQLSAFQGLDVLVSWNEMTTEYPVNSFGEDGMHANELVATRQADVILNLRCNAAISDKYPISKTCCYNYTRPNYIQIFVLFTVLAGLPLWIATRKGILGFVLNRISVDGAIDASTYRIPTGTLHSLFVFGLACVLCFYSDRTQVFDKMAKQYSSMMFTFLSLATTAVGLAFLKTESKDQPFLNRYQTDEWKGWMQFAILIYHYTGASKVSAIYDFIRIMVASYLFMTGFGHTVFFIRKADYGFKRVAGVLVRLNILSCVLPYIMKTDYLFYYFAPLTTFWFGVVWCTMRVGSSRNSSARFLVAKIVLSAVVFTTITKVPLFFDTVFAVLNKTCNIDWNVTEWRFRIELDMWIVYIGMLTAILFTRISSGSITLLPRHIRTSVIVSVLVLPIFFLWQYTLEDKFVYNGWHAYVSWIPILSFIVLRNATARLRNAHSTVFAWLGGCSLETFTLQFHIWMAGDTKGLVDLGIFYTANSFGYACNFVVSTVLFVYVSWCVASATGDVTAWILKTKPAEKKSVGVPRAVEEGRGGIEMNDAGTNGNGNGVARAGEGVKRRGLEVWWDDLRIRLGVLLVGMWVLNVVSV